MLFPVTICEPESKSGFRCQIYEIKTGSQAFTRLFYELDANGFIDADVLMRI